LVAGLNDQLVRLIAEPLAGMVGGRRGLLQDRIRGDHLARDQILADAEVLERSLSLSAPERVGRHVDRAEAIGLFPCGAHFISPLSGHSTDNVSATPIPMDTSMNR